MNENDNLEKIIENNDKFLEKSEDSDDYKVSQK